METNHQAASPQRLPIKRRSRRLFSLTTMTLGALLLGAPRALAEWQIVTKWTCNTQGGGQGQDECGQAEGKGKIQAISGSDSGQVDGEAADSKALCDIYVSATTTTTCWEKYVFVPDPHSDSGKASGQFDATTNGSITLGGGDSAAALLLRVVFSSTLLEKELVVQTVGAAETNSSAGQDFNLPLPAGGSVNIGYTTYRKAGNHPLVAGEGHTFRSMQCSDTFFRQNQMVAYGDIFADGWLLNFAQSDMTGRATMSSSRTLKSCSNPGPPSHPAPPPPADPSPGPAAKPSTGGSGPFVPAHPTTGTGE